MARNSYHHGNLRDALIEAGLALLEEGGGDAFSLRACAARAGVSHAAPAHHFGDMKALMTALAIRGFEDLSARVGAVRDSAGRDAAQIMLAAGDAYIGFAQAKPALFGLMFDPARVRVDDTVLVEAVGKLRVALAGIAAPAARRTGPAGPHTAALMQGFLWSMFHGQAQLALAAHTGMTDLQKQAGPVLRTVTDLMLDG